MHKGLKRKVILGVVCFLMSAGICGCTDEVITVAGIQDPELTQDEYIMIENFELKQEEENDKEEIAYCAVMIPSGYVESDEVPGMYVHTLSPLDSSNIYYTVLDGTGDGEVSKELTAEVFEQELEAAYEKQGETVDITIEEFARNDMEGIPGYKIRSSFHTGKRDVQQLAYIILAKETHVITYNQLSDDELLSDFEISEGQIRLVKEKSIKS